ncbi:MAG: 16S rRNA (guanine(527)-N(7))-methyltransferase RsmG [Planctomycetes bacterium]|nr:16S rRNA (guanine(527)-N(7))-methyltransferase RsmG [Planctomycetota bacterium]
MPKRHDAFTSTLTQALDRWDLSVTPAQLEQLCAHFEALVEANRVMNLTRITEPVEAAVKHYADSLALLLWVREDRIDVGSLLDIGTGAGFPAVPLAVLKPLWDITAIDGTRKKIRFLQDAAANLRLSNVRAVHAHSSHWDAGRRFDVITQRAVSRLPDCLHAAARYVTPGGWIVLYKTAVIDPEELDAGILAAQTLRLTAPRIYPYDLEFRGDPLQRALYIFQRAC